MAAPAKKCEDRLAYHIRSIIVTMHCAAQQLAIAKFVMAQARRLATFFNLSGCPPIASRIATAQISPGMNA